MTSGAPFPVVLVVNLDKGCEEWRSRGAVPGSPTILQTPGGFLARFSGRVLEATTAAASGAPEMREFLLDCGSAITAFGARSDRSDAVSAGSWIEGRGFVFAHLFTTLFTLVKTVDVTLESLRTQVIPNLSQDEWLVASVRVD